MLRPGAVDTGLVETIEIAGVDRTAIKKERARFRHAAVSPEQAAERILRGVERNRYWVYTSRDVQVGHFLHRHFEYGYVLFMRLANDRFTAILGRRAGQASN